LKLVVSNYFTIKVHDFDLSIAFISNQFLFFTPATFMIVDCGGGTVDLTTHRLLKDDKVDEIIVRKGDSCGGSFVDEEFLSFIGQKIGNSALEEFRKDHYSQLQYLVQEFCRRVKIPFTGKKLDYTTPVEFHLKGKKKNFLLNTLILTILSAYICISLFVNRIMSGYRKIY